MAIQFFSGRFFTLKSAVFSLIISTGLLAGFGVSAEPGGISAPNITSIQLWNGNKTASRQQYERELLEAVLTATQAQYGQWALREDKTDYPAAADEASVFRAKGVDIFGTVAGNAKLADEQKIMVPLPLMKGLLGYRILIIRAADKAKFAAIKSPAQLQSLRMGIPATWADAELFRHNGYKVQEKGSFDDLFTRLSNKEFDYVTFGANEVAGVFKARALAQGDLVIDNSLLVYYPFPLVFYVNPNNAALAERVTRGLEIIAGNGELDSLFARYFGDELTQLALPARTKISLDNPMLPEQMKGFAPSL